MLFEGASIIPPDAPVPSPPGAKFFLMLPVYIVGVILAFSLAYFSILEFRDWFFPVDTSREMAGERPEEFELILPNNAHLYTDTPEHCSYCHEGPAQGGENDLMTSLGLTISREDLPEDVELEQLYKRLEGLGDNSFVQEGAPVGVAMPRVGKFRGNEICMNCHSYEAVDLAHGGHFFQPIRECTSCHDLHDPNQLQDSLLAYPRGRLCSRCHDLP